MTQHTQLLVNADDFGRHLLINQAVCQSVETGILRSATLMPGGKAFDDAVHIAKTHPALGVGIHFTLVNGFPLCPPEDIPSLVTKDGVFFDDYTIFIKQYALGHISLDDVRRELGAQAEKFKQTGLTPTHFDSHQHMHVLPGVIDIALSIARDAGITKLRIPRTPLAAGGHTSLGQFIGRLGLSTLATLAAMKAKRKGFHMPNHFTGIVAGEAVQEKDMLHVIQHIQPGTTEVMIHPGTDNAILQKDCAWVHDFEAELQALVSPLVQQALQKQDIHIVNYTTI